LLLDFSLLGLGIQSRDIHGGGADMVESTVVLDETENPVTKIEKGLDQLTDSLKRLERLLYRIVDTLESIDRKTR
jgi:hypothetical protein